MVKAMFVEMTLIMNRLKYQISKDKSQINFKTQIDKFQTSGLFWF